MRQFIYNSINLTMKIFYLYFSKFLRLKKKIVTVSKVKLSKTVIHVAPKGI